ILNVNTLFYFLINCCNLYNSFIASIGVISSTFIFSNAVINCFAYLFADVFVSTSSWKKDNCALADAISLRSEEHTSELQSRLDLVCRLLLEKKKRCVRCCEAGLGGTRGGEPRGRSRGAAWRGWRGGGGAAVGGGARGRDRRDKASGLRGPVD